MLRAVHGSADKTSLWRPSRQAATVGCLIIAGCAVVWPTVWRSSCRPAVAGFWFDDVTYSSGKLGGSLTPEDLKTVIAVAREEVTGAFGGLNIAFTDRRDAPYRVRVAQELRDMRFRWLVSVPAESRAVSGLGGQGAVSFSWLASSAIVHAPDDASRSMLIDAIGRGICRAAVHEFVHVLLPRAPIHDSTDVRSYEYHSAVRREQYYERLHWDFAWPLLQQRLRPCATNAR